MKKDFIFNDVNKLKGVSAQLSKYLKKKKIEKFVKNKKEENYYIRNLTLNSSKV